MKIWKNGLERQELIKELIDWNGIALAKRLIYFMGRVHDASNVRHHRYVTQGIALEDVIDQWITVDTQRTADSETRKGSKTR